MNDQTKPPVSDLPVFRLVQPDDACALGRLFERLRNQGVEKFFHPHPLTHEAAAERAAYVGQDVYCVMEIGADLGATAFCVAGMTVMISPISVSPLTRGNKGWGMAGGS